MTGSDAAHVLIGSGTTICELVFDALAMRAMAELSVAVVSEMDARYAQETAAGHAVPGRRQSASPGIHSVGIDPAHPRTAGGW
ncbi:MAG: hypothetical protein WBA97_26290 [Actinophytocola sp.]|uniref:hypothetical protein n=1 Tax=Actinophytocola sp. TaxID=1872138 RepID=UPI003C75CEF9